MEVRKEPFWKKLMPLVSRHWLKLLSGVLWSVVGVVLCMIAARWLVEIAWPYNIAAAFGGFAAGVVIYRYGFSNIARKNIARIHQLPDRTCLFAFQAWKSYILIGFMIFLGYTIRHSPLPRLLIAIIYMAIGSALALSSVLYYEDFT